MSVCPFARCCSVVFCVFSVFFSFANCCTFTYLPLTVSIGAARVGDFLLACFVVVETRTGFRCKITVSFFRISYWCRVLWNWRITNLVAIYLFKQALGLLVLNALQCTLVFSSWNNLLYVLQPLQRCTRRRKWDVLKHNDGNQLILWSLTLYLG